MAKTTETRLSRRKMMLVTGGAVAGASAMMAAPFRGPIKNVARNAAANIRAITLPVNLASGGYDDWLAVVGSSFAIGGGTLIQLAGVRALPTSGAKPAGVRTLGFAAFFDQLSGPSLAPDRIYSAMHSRYGATQIFLAGTSDPRTPGRMVAVFN